MSQVLKILGQSMPSATTLTDIYTVPALTQAAISSIIIANQSETKTNFRISVAVAGAADDPKQYISYDIEIAGKDMAYITVGITLGAGDVIRVYATLATLSFNIFGTEVS